MRVFWKVLWLLAATCALGLACNGGDDDNGDDGDNGGTVVQTPVIPGTFNFTITGECQAVMQITELWLVRGQEVKYCNTYSAKATLKFSVAGLLPGGATQVDLLPGECITHTLASDFASGDYTWEIACEGYTGSSGGGPVKVHDPPPQDP